MPHARCLPLVYKAQVLAKSNVDIQFKMSRTPAPTNTVTVGGITYQQPTGLFINNEYVNATSNEKIVSINPATEEEITTVQAASKEDVDYAVSCARKAFNETWRHVTGVERAQLLRNLADEMQKDYDTIVAIEAADSGKPRHQNANFDVSESIELLRYYAGAADRITGECLMNDPKRVQTTRHQPYGVVGQIIPWNYPVAMAIWKIAPAIAAGNCIVLKTAEFTPLSMLYFGYYIQRAGFPPGVINIISGYGPVAGDALSRHMDVDKVAFTGSTATGKHIMTAAAQSNLKNVTLELGGKSAALVFADADLDQAAKWCAEGIMYNMGQVCCATSRVFVQDTVYDKFVKMLAGAVEARTNVGDVNLRETTHGPQVSKSQFERVLNYIDIGKKEGATVSLGGHREGNRGYYVAPTIFSDVTNDMRIAKEEIFGPVVTVIKFKTPEEAIAGANSSEYGLGGAVFTKDLTLAHQMANDMDTGTVWVNSSCDQDYHMPFGGFKMSGIGSELGSYGLNAYVHPKTVQINLGYKL